MSFVERLVGLVRDVVGREPETVPGEEDDEHLAAAALLVHVARVDGRISDGERQRLLGLLEASFGLTRPEADALVFRADRLDLEVDDVAALVEMLGHYEDGLDRSGFLALAYRVAAADGGLAEFEDDLLWRVGRLLGLDDAEVAGIRAAGLALA